MLPLNHADIALRSISGFSAAIFSNTFAAPDGFLRPCSHSCSVRTETPSSLANPACDKPAPACAAVSWHFPAGIISSFSTVPSRRVISRRMEPFFCWMNSVFRAHCRAPPASTSDKKRLYGHFQTAGNPSKKSIDYDPDFPPVFMMRSPHKCRSAACLYTSGSKTAFEGPRNFQ